MKIAIAYTAFAIIATIANLGSQELIFQLYHYSFRVELSVLAGTAIGLVVKYVLDKRYIFKVEVNSTHKDMKLFVLYAITGVFTTAVFWGSEYAFAIMFDHRAMRYLGGALGLAVGYVLKYQLDKKWVFSKYV